MNTETTTHQITQLEDNFAGGKTKYRESVFSVSTNKNSTQIGYLVQRHYRTGKYQWAATDATCDLRVVGYGSTQAEALTALDEYLAIN